MSRVWAAADGLALSAALDPTAIAGESDPRQSCESAERQLTLTTEEE